MTALDNIIGHLTLGFGAVIYNPEWWFIQYAPVFMNLVFG